MCEFRQVITLLTFGNRRRKYNRTATRRLHESTSASRDISADARDACRGPNAWNRSERRTLRAGRGAAFKKPDLLLPGITLENYGDINDYRQALKPIFDAIWNSAGCAASPNYQPNGKWRGGAR
jgi:hypothetical protein